MAHYTSTTVTHAALLSNASLLGFTPPTGFGAALTTAFTGTVSGGALPLTPVGLIATAGNGQVTITWNAVAGATSYKLYMNTAPGISLTNPANMHHPSVNSPFVHPNLANGTTYYFVVTAVNVNGESIGSTEVSATPQALPVITLTATPFPIANGATSTLNWTSTNSTSCVSTGGGGTGITGTFITPALTATTVYTVTCTGAGGTASRSATVTVVLAQFNSVPGGCVRDNVSGLMWEVKTADGGLRDWSKTYSNYESTLSAQKFDYMTGPSNPSQAEIDAPTNSVGFKNAVNATNLCGFSDWRLPTIQELLSIIKLGSVPVIDTTWFPNTQASSFWSATPVSFNAYDAAFVDFGYGGVVNYSYRFGNGHVRLVRAGQ